MLRGGNNNAPLRTDLQIECVLVLTGPEVGERGEVEVVFEALDGVLYKTRRLAYDSGREEEPGC